LESLGGRRSSLKRAPNGAWKSLDFLGFSRPDRAFSMGYGRIPFNKKLQVPLAETDGDAMALAVPEA
jgi:hypothetical protein